MTLFDKLPFAWILTIAVLSSLRLIGQEKVTGEFELEVQLEERYFFKKGLYQGQERSFLSLALQPEYSLKWNEGNQSIQTALFFRLNQHDSRRTHFDVREFYYQKVEQEWEWSVGFKKIFWGVTESVHLVDIINQTDQVESFDGEQKLGQPMVHASIPSKIGTFDLFYMPYARRRQFPGESGRLRFPVDLERQDIEIDSDLESWYPSLAARWSNFFGPMDIGLSNFYGVGREPLFEIDETGEVTALYPIINQAGIDLQLTTGPVLWKVESIYRYAMQQDFTALAAGFEYTFSNIASTGLDIGLVSEYLFDSRDELALSNFDNDLFLAMRLAFNDTQSLEILAGVVQDLDGKGTFYSMEASRRLGSDWKVILEGRWFSDIESGQLAYFFREDSFMQFSVSKFF